MADATQTVLTVGLPTLAVLIGILVNNSRLSDLNNRLSDMRGYMDGRFNHMEGYMEERFKTMDQLFQERLRRVEEVMDARLSRIEQELHLK